MVVLSTCSFFYIFFDLYKKIWRCKKVKKPRLKSWCRVFDMDHFIFAKHGFLWWEGTTSVEVPEKLTAQIEGNQFILEPRKVLFDTVVLYKVLKKKRLVSRTETGSKNCSTLRCSKNFTV